MVKGKKQKAVPPTVLVLSLVSLFNDIASEMIYPIVPLFLTTVLGAPVSVVGLIEGIAEATVWPFVLFARFIDRLGKGVRTSARDSLLLQNTTKENKGFIFGFHRAVDSLGAVIGPLLALVLLSVFKENMRLTFMVAFIPAVIGLFLLVFFVKERTDKGKHELDKKKNIKISWREINPSLKIFFLVSMIFALGNSADSFLILRSKQLGLTTTLTVLAYVLYNVVQTVFSTPGGQLADKIGARRVYFIGLIVFAFVYFGFSFIQNAVFIWILFPVYGLYIAFTDGVSKAYISEFITERESGTYFGIYQTGMAICQFMASFIGGGLWSSFGPSYTFLYGAAMAVLALGVSRLAR